MHTQHGADLLRTFAIDVCGCRGDWTMASFIDEAVARIQAEVGDGRVVCGLSGGVDSTVAALLVHKAIGDRLTCIFVDNGLLREQEAAQVEDRFRNRMKLPLVVVDAASRFLARLAGVTDPEKKRKIIGAEFIDVFEDAAKEHRPVRLPGAGHALSRRHRERVGASGRRRRSRATTTSAACPSACASSWSSRCGSCSRTKCARSGCRSASKRTSSGGSRSPGPGLAVRLLGEITRAAPGAAAPRRRRRRRTRSARPGWYRRLWQSFAVLLPVQSVGVMGDERTYEHTIAIRAVESKDGMTADWARLPHDLLARISSRVVNEVKGINRVVYDISSKPPSTIEWE